MAATTFYTVPLSQRAVLYDVRYCSREHLLETDYVVLAAGDKNSVKSYATDDEKTNGLEQLCALLESEGYTRRTLPLERLIIYVRTAS